MSSLFLDHEHKIKFEKLAMPVRLSESPEQWQREIAAEIYKQVPFLGDYAVNVILDRVDNQRGFGFGSAHISNKTEIPSSDTPSIRIPIIVRNYIMSSMDVFMDSTGVYPLSESRVREKLFRSSTFEVSNRKPGDKNLMDQLYPPFRSNFGMGQGGEGMGMNKLGNQAEQARRKAVAGMHAAASSNSDHIGTEKDASLIRSIASTISETDADNFVDEISSNSSLAFAAANNEHFSKLAMTIASGNTLGLAKTANALVESIKPTVVQIQKFASGNFKVKWANANAFMPQEDTVTPEVANQMTGMNLSGMHPGTITVSTEKAQKQTLREETYKPVTEYGTYTVHNMDTNQEMIGTILPIMDFDMHPLEMLICVTETGYAVQDEIVGISQGEDSPPPTLPLQQADGNGAFVFDVSGKMKSLEPVTVKTKGQTPQGFQLQCETVFGDMISLVVTPGLESIELIQEGLYGIPDWLLWMPLAHNPIYLAKNSEELDTVKDIQSSPQTVGVGSSGQGEFSLEGPPLAKVATSQKHFVKTAQAEFLLVAMGVNPIETRQILKEAETGKYIKVACNTLTPLADIHVAMVKKAQKDLSDFPYHLRKNLIKEAAVIEDEDTADKILAMNFINPENIDIFAKYLPELDQAAKKLAEMLLAVRLGMGSVEEGAVERAMKGLEQVIEGLKILQQKVSAT